MNSIIMIKLNINCLNYTMLRELYSNTCYLFFSNIIYLFLSFYVYNNDILYGN